MKHGSYMVWPVRSDGTGSNSIPRSGQDMCFSAIGAIVPCPDSGQDGALQMGAPWPKPRLIARRETVLDKLTGLQWTKLANQAGNTVDWESSIDIIKRMNEDKAFGFADWRLPNIRELESLVDAGSHTPALPHGYPFKDVGEFYWSSTTSTYDPHYAWVLYTEDGSVGVGYKSDSSFLIWAVRTATGQ
jgi:hypothetical protein